jgi:hypothetical protein
MKPNNHDLLMGGLFCLAIGSFVPVWRSGRRGNLTFWQFVLNHTIFGPEVEYVPEEDYTRIALPYSWERVEKEF